jgi:protein-S-isoprenylcysteine O-methyltransferase Ste14
MKALELRVPPPIVVVLVAVAMWLNAHVTPALQVNSNLRNTIAVVFALTGLIIGALGGVAFHRAKTTTNPLKPEAASSLVTSGVYRYTRNPMYLGLTAMLIGWAVYLAAPLEFLGPIVFVLFITRFQIIPEERVLRSKFGPEFSAYQARVRRWL